MTIELLKDELIGLCDIADKITGIHKDVAKEVGISIQYSARIRSNEALTTNNKENRMLVRKMIKAYRNRINKFHDKISKRFNIETS